MNNTGLLALNGIPGSGKTLDAVNIAIKHYKSENRFYKYYIALIRNKIYTLFIKNKYFNKISTLAQKLWSKKIVRFILKGSYYFLKLFLFLCLFVGFSIYFKIFIIWFLLRFDKSIKSLSSLDYDYYCLFPYKRINNVYSTFPICLDRKRNIWSNQISLFDLDNTYSFYPNSLIIIDEVQLFIDSDEYKDKVKKNQINHIGKFLQAHRHFGVKQVVFTSQSPSRIFKKARNIVVGYLKQAKLINLPFGLTLMRGIIYYDFDFYGRYIPKSHEERKKLPFDYKKVIKVFRRSTVYNAYDSRYLSLYNYARPLLNCTKGTWKEFKVPYDYLVDLFTHDDEKDDNNKRIVPRRRVATPSGTRHTSCQ